MAETEHFPNTERTWLLSLLAGDPSDVRTAHRRIMEIYAGPLEVYAQAILRVRSEDAREAVHGFFASRLGRLDYIARWDPTTMRLRRWLMNGLCFYLRERRRDAEVMHPIDDVVDMTAPPADAARKIDREFAAGVVRNALEQARKLCADQGLDEHWRIFHEHQVKERPYATLVPEFGKNEARLAVMGRTATKRFIEAVRATLRLDGVSEAFLADEVRALIGDVDGER